ncbi:hypothetical protein MAM1_0200c07851 [Mucor ambiguus]|uniref:Uncharacterized protein n=1 Tax=Mucor ambiguus TaxID=91626 RepID=A0A0C9MXP3_9FUNG|nr:hypothetical protein MAM1_0200c07851 [Mucor ambiguus]
MSSPLSSRKNTVSLDDSVNGTNQDNNKNVNMTLNIATDISFENENEGDIVDSRVDDNGTTSAAEATVINGHAEQEAIYQMMLPYPQLQITAKFEHI